MIDVEAISLRVNAATKGPWTNRRSIEPEIPATIVNIYYDEQGRRCTRFVAVCNGHGCESDSDAIFIAAARTDVPALIAHVRELEARLMGLAPKSIRKDLE